MGSSSVPSFDWAHVGSILFGILFVFGPVVVYVSPFLAINIRGSVDGFHPLISIILLAAHLMRIEFFLLRPYASIILFQSYVMIIAQVAMLLSVLTARLKERAAARCKHVGEPFRMCAADHVQFKGMYSLARHLSHKEEAHPPPPLMVKWDHLTSANIAPHALPSRSRPQFTYQG